jgi:thioredoxin reductase/CRP-like cAMP-binding protein/Fe-S-cluster-containing hydrogenase component 2
MATERVKIAIVGGGPGGLSAAARAAEANVSHILLESSPQLANTIFKYQKGKHVMDEPGVLPLRASVGFEAGTRERILGVWDEGVRQKNARVRYGAEVTAISGSRGAFEVKLASGDIYQAEFIILAIGLQGNLRKMECPGDDLPQVQYQLDDPGAYSDEAIVVVGAGDAAIENAIALAAQNKVTILNRRDEFSRAKDGNIKNITRAIEGGDLECRYNCGPTSVEELPPGHESGRKLRLKLKAKEGAAEIFCDRIIARLGAMPPRAFVEACGVQFPNKDPNAVPAVSPQYESNVPGLFIIGALAGYPLIKQCMNQGYEVVEYVEGRPCEPADAGLLREKFSKVPGLGTVDEALARIQQKIPLFAGLTPLQLREFLLDSDLHTPAKGESVIVYNDYTDTFFSILNGTVNIHKDPNDLSKPPITIGTGKFFGEMSLISGRRRSATITAGDNCVLIETPRRSMNKLLQSVASVRRAIDEAFLLNAIRTHIAPEIPEQELTELVQTATLKEFNSGEALFLEGDPGDSLYLVRSGSVTIAYNLSGREVVYAYMPSGNYVGELALLTDSKRTATVRAAVLTETVRLEGAAFKSLLTRYPALNERMQAAAQRLREATQRRALAKGGNVIDFLVAQGVGEATDVLVIDESLCVRCDNCEKACSDTHNGTSMLDREAGPTFASLHVPTSCRHCEHPHCMKDCPADAIHRTPGGEVYIADNCIGCGNCSQNCPYGVIQMAYKVKPKRPSLISWLMFGRGPAPGDETHEHPKDAQKKAVKCDMCKDQHGGPACVRACPTGAAIRVSPQELLTLKR